MHHVRALEPSASGTPEQLAQDPERQRHDADQGADDGADRAPASVDWLGHGYLLRAGLYQDYPFGLKFTRRLGRIYVHRLATDRLPCALPGASFMRSGC